MVMSYGKGNEARIVNRLTVMVFVTQDINLNGTGIVIIKRLTTPFSNIIM
jgi:hypothetical protein